MGPRRRSEAWTLWPFQPRKSQPHFFSSCLWTPLLFLFMGPGASGENAERMVGVTGASANFSLNLSAYSEIELVTWSGPYGSFILIPAEGIPQFTNKSYKRRLNITVTSYSFSLYNLTLKDSGHYEAKINHMDSEDTANAVFTLTVYDPLREPQVILKSVTVSENASCTITLICSVQGEGKDVRYSWAPVGLRVSESSGNSTLTISWMPCDQDMPYTCKAQNPVSQTNSHPVFARQFCTDAVASREGPVVETVEKLLGASFRLPLALPDTQDVERVLWIFNTSIINSTREGITTVTQSKVPDKNEVWVSNQDHSLNIGHLRMENTGTYHAYVCSRDSRVISMKHVTLLIYRKLKTPRITRGQFITDNGFCKVKLECSLEDSEPDVTYCWTSSVQEGIVHKGSQFQPSWKLGEDHPTFSCTASNPVSNSSWMFVSEDNCPGPDWILPIVFSLLALFLLCTMAVAGWAVHFIFVSLVSFLYIFVTGSSSLIPAFSLEPPGIPKLCPLRQMHPARRRVRGWVWSQPCMRCSRLTTDHLLSTLPQVHNNRDTPLKASNHQQKNPTSSSSDSGGTSEDEERTKIPPPVWGRGEVCVPPASENSARGLAPEVEAQYNLITPSGTDLAPVVNGDTVYAHLFHNSKGMDPILQKKEVSVTIYCSVQRSQMVVPPSQDDPESSENSTYENFT
ncbi:PREDICTED: T-lymphocyte surface antigen Ly-9 [Condylura cristata]|uniref:T-lymphocyte surface antigen Ly-9 n=1 Tax=Condylura cristata TaxID=143302 RepID=UPI00064351FC|nr:PREDICTED: T-lymphocyte surface antigen Ly-9 [Condylura cristata]